MELINSIDETFKFENKEIRVLGNYHEPLFVAKDICNILELSNVTESLRNIPEKWKCSEILNTLTRGKQTMIILKEPAVYQLIMRSNKPIAQKFQEVVCEEILPTLRKKGEYKIQSIIDEKLKLENENLKLQEEKEELDKKLFEEQKNLIKAKKSLEKNQKKFSQRHKFTETSGCVYILSDPENPLNKFKIGFTHDINERLASDRTMIPNIKVVFIMYTQYYELFEKIIKIKYEKHFQFQSHEWILLDKFENENFLIKGLKDINNVCGFSCKIEDDLWKYNLEEPPKIEESKTELNMEDDEKLFEKKHLNFAGKLSLILPTYLLRYEYDKRNAEAAKGFRYCNGFCQTYQNINFFTMKSLSPLTICMKCDSMIDIANIKITNGILTAEEIRRDPLLLDIKDDEKICRKCCKIKNKEEFPEKRRQCKTCRNGTRSKYGKDFDNIIEEEIKILNELTLEHKIVKINLYVKDELQKIISYLKIGRKYNDTKQTMTEKIIEYYKNENL